MSEERLELATGGAPRDPEELETQASQLSPLTHLGPVQLTVSNLEQSKGTLFLGRRERT